MAHLFNHKECDDAFLFIPDHHNQSNTGKGRPSKEWAELGLSDCKKAVHPVIAVTCFHDVGITQRTLVYLSIYAHLMTTVMSLGFKDFFLIIPCF